MRLNNVLFNASKTTTRDEREREKNIVCMKQIEYVNYEREVAIARNLWHLTCRTNECIIFHCGFFSFSESIRHKLRCILHTTH